MLPKLESAVLGFSPRLILYGMGAAAELVVEERCLANKAVSPLVAELAQSLVPSHFASLIQTVPRNLSSPHDPAAERRISSLSTGLEGAWGSMGQSRGLAPLAGLHSPGELLPGRRGCSPGWSGFLSSGLEIK